MGEDMDFFTVENSKKSYKYYTHFDKKIRLFNSKAYITNVAAVSKHSFFPFIKFTKKMTKYNKKSGRKLKERTIMYSSHIDRYIYKYYSFNLNDLYNKKVIERKINDSVIAYRNNLGKNNIHFAKQAFDFINAQDSCEIIVGDFTSFFDTLDHKILYETLCNVLGVDWLSSDWFNIYRSITKFSYVEISKLIELNGKKLSGEEINDFNKLSERKRNKLVSKFNKLDRAISLKRFGTERKKKDFIQYNMEVFGIPQGSPISAVLSNVYMLDFDQQLFEFANELNGLYLRYSDDFIIIIPSTQDETLKYNRIVGKVEEEAIKNKLTIEKEKTQYFIYDGQRLYDNNNNLSLLNYLGFSFDGSKIKVRDKTTTKYHYKMYRSIKKIKRNIENGEYIGKENRFKKKHGYKTLYIKYSNKGANPLKGNKKSRGNYLTYLNRTRRVFSGIEDIEYVRERHYKKIRKRLNKIEKNMVD